ncbi:Lantibiotic dehydratase, C terminus [Facklamia miroungae]|uniref:Lantibiotic dehydratase, C terminus n=2 Tax=Facklamia miroungae TaxID=120956 RepID=A0A1G7VEE3_9LACT|nr:hypothetical protein [Facklamia miroungae]SDG57310.1 Lantibiotic dehydratase, C terminus [Facklamia miroungae]
MQTDINQSNLNTTKIYKVITLLKKIKKIPTIDFYHLEDYKNRFITEYGYNRFVNVLELFDESKGLGSPFTDEKLSIHYYNEKEKYFSKLNDLLSPSTKNNDQPNVCSFNENFVNNINTSIMSDVEEDWDGFDINFKLFDSNNIEYLYIDNIATSFNPGGFRGRFDKVKISNEIKTDQNFGLQYWSSNKKIWNVVSKIDPSEKCCCYWIQKEQRRH